METPKPLDPSEWPDRFKPGAINSSNWHGYAIGALCSSIIWFIIILAAKLLP